MKKAILKKYNCGIFSYTKYFPNFEHVFNWRRNSLKALGWKELNDRSDMSVEITEISRDIVFTTSEYPRDAFLVR